MFDVKTLLKYRGFIFGGVMSTVDYQTAYDSYLSKYMKYANYTPSGTSKTGNPVNAQTSTGAQAYNSGISDAGFGANTCSDGIDDGKIGIDGVLLNLGEGVLKGAWNGIVGAVTDSEGKFSVGKTLLSVGMVGACIAFPALGAVACGIGAVAGGSQLVKGLSVALDTKGKSDAEVKAAWENIGEGGSTIVGCALGAKASIGAVKAAAAAAASADDVVKALGSTDDIIKALGSADDAAKNLGDTAKLTKFLKSKGIDNATDIMSAYKDGFKSVDEMVDVVSKGAKMSKTSLASLDDSTKGVQKWVKTAKAFADDVVSSTKNNMKNASKMVKSGVNSLKSEKSKLQAEIDDMTKMLKETSVDSDEYLELSEAIRQKKLALDLADDTLKSSDVAKKASQAAEKRKNNNAAKKAEKTYKKLGGDEALKKAEVDYDAAAKQMDALRKTDSKNQDAINAAGEKLATAADKLDGLTDAKEALESANKLKTETRFGQLTSRIQNSSKTYQHFSDAIKSGKMSKMIKSLNPLDVIPNLGKDGITIYNYLKDGKNLSETIKQFGYGNTMEVLKVIYSIGQVNQTV